MADFFFKGNDGFLFFEDNFQMALLRGSLRRAHAKVGSALVFAAVILLSAGLLFQAGCSDSLSSSVPVATTNPIQQSSLEKQTTKIQQPKKHISDSSDGTKGNKPSVIRNPEPPPRPKLKSLVGTELLWNGSFEHWAGGPVGWNPIGLESILPSADAIAGEKCVRLFEGMYENSRVEVRQDIPGGPEIIGKTIEVRAQGKALAPKTLIMAIEYTKDGRREIIKSSHSGNGEWTFMGKKLKLSKGIDPTSLTLRIFRRTDGQGDVWFDHARAKVE